MYCRRLSVLLFNAFFCFFAALMPLAVRAQSIPTPTNVYASGLDTAASISWNASAGATGYNIKRSDVSGGPYSTVGQAPLNGNGTLATYFSDGGLTNGTSYFYVVSALGSGGESANSSEVVANPVASARLSSLIIQSLDNAGTLNFTFKYHNYGNAATTLSFTKFSLLDSTTAVGILQKPSLPYSIGTLAPGADSAAVQIAFTGVSAYAGKRLVFRYSTQFGSSGSATISVPSASDIPRLSLGTVSTSNAAVLWSAVTAATSYNIYRSTAASAETLYQQSVSGTSFTDTGVSNGTTYYYKVTAVTGTGETGLSNEIQALPLAAPINLAAAPSVNSSLLSWNVVPGAGSYNIYRATSSGAEGVIPYKTNIQATSFQDTPLPTGTLYYYQVTAALYSIGINPISESVHSAEVSVTAAASPVLTSIAVSAASASLTTGGMQQFTAVAKDQNGATLSPQPVIIWSVDSGGMGTITSDGLYTVGSTAGSATVRATSSSITGTASVTVTSPVVDFTTNVSPSNFGVSTTGTASTGVTLTSLGGFSGNVSLSISGLPSSATATFSPASPVAVAAGASAADTLTLTTGSTASGIYPLVLTATSGTLMHSVPLTLTIAPPVASAVRLTDVYLSSAGALTHRIEWDQALPVIDYSGPGTVSNVTITGYNISRTPGGGGGTAANMQFWIDSPPLGSSQLQFNTLYTYTVTADYYYTITNDPHQTSGGGTVTVGSCQVTSVKAAATGDQAIDSRLDLRYSTNTLLDHNFGSTFYRGGLFTGYNSDPARVGRSLIKFALPSLPGGQNLWRAGTVCAYATRGYAAGTATVYCRRVSDAWTGPAVVWSQSPAFPALPSPLTGIPMASVAYDGTNPVNAWQHWNMAPDIYEALVGNGGTLSVGLAATDETQNVWLYFAKKEYDATLAPCVLYSYGAPN